MPHLHNCKHNPSGWCLDCVKKLHDEAEVWKRGHDRYETVRRLTPRKFDAAWDYSVNTGKPFDELIDNMHPFYFPDPNGKSL